MSVWAMYQKLQQSVGPIDIVDDLIHVLHGSFPKLLHHEKDVDQQSTENLEVTEEKCQFLSNIF